MDELDPRNKSAFNHSVDFRALHFGRMRIETIDGATREGKITRLHYGQRTVLGRVLQYPERIVLDNEESDYIPWELVKTITKIGE